MWDNPTMSISTIDSKKRIVLPGGRPGDVFDIQQQAEGRFLLIRLEKPEACRTHEQKGVYGGHAQGSPATDDDVGEASRTDP